MGNARNPSPLPGAAPHAKGATPFHDLRPRLLASLALLAILAGVVALERMTGLPFFGILCLGAAGLCFLELCRAMRSGERKKPFSGLIAGAFVLGVAFGGAAGLGAAPYWLAFILLTVAANDTGSYFFGRWFGGRRLAASLSPGKTYSGALGGLASGGFAGFLLSGGSGTLVLLAACIALLALAGDLAASAIKRACAIKDFGTLIPGHGGLLDRLDGLIAVLFCLTLLGAGLGAPSALMAVQHLARLTGSG